MNEGGETERKWKQNLKEMKEKVTKKMMKERHRQIRRERVRAVRRKRETY